MVRVAVHMRHLVEEPQAGGSGQPLLPLHIDEHAHRSALFSCSDGGVKLVRLLDILQHLDDALALAHRAAAGIYLELNGPDARLVILKSRVDFLAHRLRDLALPDHHEDVGMAGHPSGFAAG